MKGPRDADQRADPRADLVLKVEYPSADGFLQDYTMNISQGGTMIRTQHDLQVGDAVRLLLSFPGLLSPIRLSGFVRWVQPLDAPPYRNVGVEFDRERNDSWATLSTLVEKILQGDRAIVAPVVNILVVEDNPHLVKLISVGLAGLRERSGVTIAFSTRHATDGKVATELLEAEEFNLLIVDMFLPVMSGDRLIQAVRHDQRWRELPIIAVSCGGEDARRLALEAGADFFLDKPFRLADVLGTIWRLMGIQEGSDENAP
jgi:uncharacterized protein (TIGR02266 family)